MLSVPDYFGFQSLRAFFAWNAVHHTLRLLCVCVCVLFHGNLLFALLGQGDSWRLRFSTYSFILFRNAHNHTVARSTPWRDILHLVRHAGQLDESF